MRRAAETGGTASRLHGVLLFLRTLHLQGVGRSDFSLWSSAIQRAAGGRGTALRDQQLSRNDIPIIVDSCISFITQYGEEEEEPAARLCRPLSSRCNRAPKVWPTRESTARTEPRPESSCSWTSSGRTLET